MLVVAGLSSPAAPESNQPDPVQVRLQVEPVITTHTHCRVWRCLVVHASNAQCDISTLTAVKDPGSDFFPHYTRGYDV